MNSTKSKLLEAAADVIREEGIAALSARSIAARAEVNQALIFYHFGSVAALVDGACRLALDASIASYRDDFDRVTSFSALLALGNTLHERELASGNVAMMAQLMAGAQNNPAFAELAGFAMHSWNQQLEPVVRRVIDRNPLSDVLDVPGLTRVISAGFIGLELYAGADPEGAALASAVLETLAILAVVVDDLGPLARKAVQAKLRGAQRKGVRSARILEHGFEAQQPKA